MGLQHKHRRGLPERRRSQIRRIPPGPAPKPEQAPRGPERDPPAAVAAGVGPGEAGGAGRDFRGFRELSEAEWVLIRGFGEGGLCGRGLFSRAAAAGVAGLVLGRIRMWAKPLFFTAVAEDAVEIRAERAEWMPRDHRESPSAWVTLGHASRRAGWMGRFGRGGRRGFAARGVTGRPVLSGRGGAASLFPLLPAGLGTRGGRNGLPSPGGLGFRPGGASNRPPRSRFPSGIPAPRR